MADSANILSILSSLAPPPGADAPDVQLPGVTSNVLQGIAPQTAASQPSSTEDIYHAAVAASPPAPKPRRSLLDTIGRISDVIATVGGAQPLYESNLEHRQDRGFAIDDRQRKIDADNLKLVTDKFALGNSRNERLGQVLAGASQADNPAEVFNQVAPTLLSDYSPDEIAKITSYLQQNPKAAGPMAIQYGFDPVKVYGTQGNAYSGSVIPITMKDGTTHAFALNKSTGKLEDVTAPEGQYTPGSVKVVDRGNQQTVIDPKTGRTIRSFGVSGKPSEGESPVYDANGNLVGYQVTPGSQRDYMQTGNTLKNVQAAKQSLTGIKSVMPLFSSMRAAIEDMKNTGSISYPGMTPEQSVQLSLWERSPGLFRAQNQSGYSAQQKINTLATNAMLSIAPILNSLNGVQIGGRMMDSGKEQENMRSAIVNAKDYDSAIAAVNMAEHRVREIQSYYQDQLEQQRQLGNIGRPHARPTLKTKGPPVIKPRTKPGEWSVIR